VVGGDLEFYSRIIRGMGTSCTVDCLASYFIKKLEEVGLLDVEPTKLSPTLEKQEI
jgi:hypothetical protein